MPKGMVGFQKGDLNPSKRSDRREALSKLRSGSITAEKIRKKIARSMRRRLKEPELREKWSKVKEGKTFSLERRRKSVAERRKRPKKLRSCMKYADTAFSKYIRLKYADSDFNVVCITCGESHPLVEMDCGHYVSRQHKSLRWSELNGHPQCRRCNRFNEGRKDVYALKLIELYGPDILSELQQEKAKIIHPSPEEVWQIASLYKAKAKAILQAKTGANPAEFHKFIDHGLPVGEICLEPD
jgi:hypothetical protein